MVISVVHLLSLLLLLPSTFSITSLHQWPLKYGPISAGFNQDTFFGTTTLNYPYYHHNNYEYHFQQTVPNSFSIPVASSPFKPNYPGHLFGVTAPNGAIIFTPNTTNEPAATAGQIQNYKKDLDDLAKEQIGAIDEDDFYMENTKSFVNFHMLAGRPFQYNYSI